jgi:O-antigen/teichoic acid export membrane protein
VKNLARNATWGASSAAVRAATGLVIALIALRLLGGESYGQMVTLLSLFVVYLALNSGVFTVLVTRLIRVATTERTSSDDDILSAALLLTVSSIAVLGLLTALLWMSVPGVFSSMSLGPDSLNALRKAVLLMGVVTALQIVTALYSAIIDAAGRLDLAMRWQLVGPLTVAITLCLLFLFEVPVTVPGYVVVLGCGAALDMILLALVRGRLMPSTTLRMSTSKRTEIWVLLKSGTTLQAASLMGVFLEPLNKFLLNHFSGPLAVTAYDFAMKFIWGIHSLLGGGMRVFLHLAEEQGKVVSHVYYRVVALVLVPVLALHVVAAVFLAWVVHYWVVIGDPMQIMIFFAIATISNLGMIYITPAFISLIGRGDFRFIFRSHSIVAVANIIASLVLIPFFGLLGAVFGLLFATAYNVVAIYRRHECIVDSSGGMLAAISGRLGRFFLTTLLFVTAILISTAHTVNYYAVGVVLLATAYILKKEPLLEFLYARITGSK